MKCIDAIEGTVKCILNAIYSVSMEGRLDDSEYIRNIKAVIDATDHYLQLNPEVVDSPEILKRVLYDYSRSLWLTGQTCSPSTETMESGASEDQEYQTYYFDYLYHHGIYPR
jgi:hypothetical protein